MIKIETVGKPYMRYLAKVIPLAFDESMSYYEQICSFKAYLLNEIMPTLNNNAEATAELQELFVTLENYVNNYFDNLDIQEEVDNKLEEMYENGQLEDLISQFIELQTTYTYDSIEDLQSAENLVVGSYVKTLGYNSLGDNGGAYYKVREIINTDVVDNMFIIALNNEELVAELIYKDEININQLGGGDNEIGAIINSAISKGITIFNFNQEDYTCEETIQLDNSNKYVFNFNNASVTTTSSKMFNVICDNAHKSIINNLYTTGDDTNTFIELTPVSNWGCGIDINNCEIRRYLKQLYGKSLFNSRILNTQFISDNGYIQIENADGSSGNMSNCNTFDNCYIRNRTNDATSDPDYKILLNGVKNLTFNNCAFGRCKTLLSLTSCNNVELNNCQVENVNAVTNTRSGLINNTNNSFIYTTKYAESDTYKSIPTRTLTVESTNVGSASNNNVRSSILNDTTQAIYGATAYNDNNTYVALTRQSSNAINYYIPLNIIENHNDSAGTTLTTDITSIFSSQRGEATMLDVYTRIYDTDGSQKWFKDTFVLIDGSSTSARMRHMTQIDLGSTTVFSGSTIKSDTTLTNEITPTTLTTTASISCLIDVRIEFKKLGKSYQTT